MMELFVFQFLPSAIIQTILVIATWRLLKKEGLGKELQSLWGAVPVFGMFLWLVPLFLAFGRTMDRLKAIEGLKSFD